MLIFVVFIKNDKIYKIRFSKIFFPRSKKRDKFLGKTKMNHLFEQTEEDEQRLFQNICGRCNLMIFWLLSCIFGVLLVGKANRMETGSIVLYISGCILLLPSLFIFFALYQTLLKPPKNVLFNEESDDALRG